MDKARFSKTLIILKVQHHNNKFTFGQAKPSANKFGLAPFNPNRNNKKENNSSYINQQQQQQQSNENSYSFKNNVVKRENSFNYTNKKSFVPPKPAVQPEEPPKNNPFKTAGKQLSIDQQLKYGKQTSKKTLGNVRGGFKPPIPKQSQEPPAYNEPESTTKTDLEDPRYKGIDPKMIELVTNDIMDQGANVEWSDIAGLDFVKTTVKEIVVFPLLRPDIFSGLRGPPKGLLLFGPPGTGKTLIGKCIASQSKSTFFAISASSLTSKWVGEGEKMVRALFAVARVHQPSVVFIDEIDSLLTARSDNEHESSRRIKTEFLVQLDGASTTGEERILIVGATNRPQDLDEAARRRLVKRLYVPLPEFEARKQIIVRLMSSQVIIILSHMSSEIFQQYSKKKCFLI